MFTLGNSWDDVIGEEFQKPYYLALRSFLKQEYATRRIYPNMYDIYNAFKLTPYENVKVVILGQDPYHGAGQAHGLCFSVQDGVKLPPSLQNIYKELHDDIGMPLSQNGNLTAWAKEGVLLLNTTLTVREATPQSHKGQGWEVFTDAVISALDKKTEPIVFLLWGSPARAKKALLHNPAHLVLEAPHPSPLSAYSGFFGCRHFSKCNQFLEAHGVSPVHWEYVAK